MTQQHNLLHRQAILLRATEPMTSEDHQRLEVQFNHHCQPVIGVLPRAPGKTTAAWFSFSIQIAAAITQQVWHALHLQLQLMSFQSLVRLMSRA